MHRFLIAATIVLASGSVAFGQDLRPWYFITAGEDRTQIVNDATSAIVSQTMTAPDPKRLDAVVTSLNPHVEAKIPPGSLLVLPDALALAIRVRPPFRWFTCRQIPALTKMATNADTEWVNTLNKSAASHSHSTLFHVFVIPRALDRRQLIQIPNRPNSPAQRVQFGARARQSLLQFLAVRTRWADVLRTIQ